MTDEQPNGTKPRRTRGPKKPKLVICYDRGPVIELDDEITRWLREQSAFFCRDIGQEIQYRLKEIMAGRLGALATAQKEIAE